MCPNFWLVLYLTMLSHLSQRFSLYELYWWLVLFTRAASVTAMAFVSMETQGPLVCDIHHHWTALYGDSVRYYEWFVTSRDSKRSVWANCVLCPRECQITFHWQQHHPLRCCDSDAFAQLIWHLRMHFMKKYEVIKRGAAAASYN